jgi:putative ABC transport system ATP-binding protein
MFGFIFQQFNLIRDFSVIENVMLPLYPVEIKYLDMRARAEAILDKLSIIKKMNLKVQGLSGGEQQRVAIARALMNDPEIVFADEPTAHLDSRLSEELISILNSIKSDGRTIVMATHDPLMYESSIVDCIIEMRDGKVKNVSRR